MAQGAALLLWIGKTTRRGIRARTHARITVAENAAGIGVDSTSISIKYNFILILSVQTFHRYDNPLGRRLAKVVTCMTQKALRMENVTYIHLRPPRLYKI